MKDNPEQNAAETHLLEEKGIPTTCYTVVSHKFMSSNKEIRGYELSMREKKVKDRCSVHHLTG